jgi:hypothetical protein
MKRLPPLLALLLAALPATAQPGSPERAHEPVVVEGYRLPVFLGAEVDRIVGYRYDGVRWRAIPVQVDERDTVNVALAYRHGDFHPDGGCEITCQQMFDAFGPIPYWTDPDTWLGADSTDLAFDGDDEVVFMARDGGARLNAALDDPPGTVAGSRVEVRLTAPEGGDPTYVYLFRSHRPTPAPAAYVAYDPVFCSHDMQTPSDECDPFPETVPYTEHYDVYGRWPGPDMYHGYELGVNPEDTWFRGGTYRLHFSDRWILDSLALGPDGPDLIDRMKVNGYDVCGRTERSACVGRGAFIVNRSGPVRVLRAVIGYNSGPLTQRHYVLYDRYFEERTYLRLHPLTGGHGKIVYTDYSDAARGMRYHASYDESGVPIDGEPDPYPTELLEWEFVRGGAGTARGTILSLFTPTFEDLLGPHDPPLWVGMTGHYEDGGEGFTMQCTGDTVPVGASGFRFHGDVNGHLPNTDPRPWYVNLHRELYRIELLRRTVLDPANLSDEVLRRLRDRLDHPLEVTVDPDGAQTTGVERAGAGAAGTRLLPPRPNPAAGRAVVPFLLADGGPVRLAVYDVLGREVAVLHDGPMAAGPHHVALDTAALPTGTYLVRLTTPEGARTRTLTVLGDRRP